MLKRIRQSARGLALAATAFIFSVNAANAQLAANTYQFSALTGTYGDLVGGTAVAGVLTDDGTSAAINIGFTFNYCGTDYTQIKACSNGWLTFNTAVVSSTWTNTTSDLNTIKPALMPLFDDLAGWGSACAMNYQVSGTSPNQIFTIEYKNWNWRSSSAGTISFQVRLYEGSNIIQYIYRQDPVAVDAGTSATIGIGDNAGTPGFLTLDGPTASPTVSSTTFTTTISAKPATGQIYQFKPLPPIDLSADTIEVVTPFCANGWQPASVGITNRGTAIINTLTVYWSVDGVDQTPVTYSGSPIGGYGQAPANTATILLGNVFYPDATPRVIKAYTYQPNSLPDADNTNDTASGSRAPTLTGVYVTIAPQDTTICSGASIVLDAGADHPNDPIYIWNNNATASSITISQPGTYSVYVQNDEGCTDRDTVTISVHPLPLVNSIAIIDNGDGSYTFNVIGAQNITGYVWDFGDNNTQGGSGTPGQIIHAFAAAGQYTVTLTLTNDCGTITVTKLISNAGQVITGIDNVSALQKAVSIYPNPSKSLVAISTSSQIKMKSVAVYNVVGQQMVGSDNLNTEHYNINVSGLSVGIYNVLISTDQGQVTKKLEVIR
jgi:PKD repeat protein